MMLTLLIATTMAAPPGYVCGPNGCYKVAPYVVSAPDPSPIYPGVSSSCLCQPCQCGPLCLCVSPTYAEIYRRVEAGEVVYTSEIPGEPVGNYRCFLRDGVPAFESVYSVLPRCSNGRCGW